MFTFFLQSLPNILTDDRFKVMFENPDFQVDEESEEFRLLNPLVSKISEKRKKKLRLLEQQERPEEVLCSSPRCPCSCNVTVSEPEGPSGVEVDEGDLRLRSASWSFQAFSRCARCHVLDGLMLFKRKHGPVFGWGEELLLTIFIFRKRRKSRKEDQAMRKALRAPMMKRAGSKRSGSSAGCCSRRRGRSGRSGSGRTSRRSSGPSSMRSKQAKNSGASAILPPSRS